MKVNIIGLGQVGFETFKEMTDKKLDDIIGTDINQDRLQDIKAQGYSNITDKIVKADIHIISVYTTDQVIDTLNKIDIVKDYCVVIESTVAPSEIYNIKDYGKFGSLIMFPHRFNPNDPEHHVFNLKRCMGVAYDDDYELAANFYSRYMNPDLIIKTTFEIAALSKVVENAYRFCEIALAEDLKMQCDKAGIDFDELRRVANTKWNIDIKEARDGIGGHCLPKDIKLLNEIFPQNTMFNQAIYTDNRYKKK